LFKKTSAIGSSESLEGAHSASLRNSAAADRSLFPAAWRKVADRGDADLADIIRLVRLQALDVVQLAEETILFRCTELLEYCKP
jgi:hypothetical protein